MENDDIEKPSVWARLIPMIILLVCFSLAEAMVYIIALIQFIWTAVDGEPNTQLTEFGKSLSEWLRQDGRYLSYASDEKPFPWAKWPSIN